MPPAVTFSAWEDCANNITHVIRSDDEKRLPFSIYESRSGAACAGSRKRRSPKLGRDSYDGTLLPLEAPRFPLHPIDPVLLAPIFSNWRLLRLKQQLNLYRPRLDLSPRHTASFSKEYSSLLISAEN